MAFSDLELLARLIQCEAGGEGDTGMAAVASVVMNRVRASAGEYARVGQGSIRKIILQPGQFTCAMETVRGQPTCSTCPISPTSMPSSMEEVAHRSRRRPSRKASSVWVRCSLDRLP